jgi:serine protease Do
VKSLLAVTHLGYMGIVLLSAVRALTAEAPALPDVIDKIKPAIVAVGSFQKTRRPPSIFRGTGFVIADGLHVVTNAHVVPEKIDIEKKEVVAVFVGRADLVEVREATKVAEDRDHDLAVLRITGRPITTMTLGDANRVREGEIYAFTGFPIGMVLGLNAVTHRGIISAITPVVIPQLTAKLLEKKIIGRLTAPYNVSNLTPRHAPATAAARFISPTSGKWWE